VAEVPLYVSHDARHLYPYGRGNASIIACQVCRVVRTRSGNYLFSYAFTLVELIVSFDESFQPCTGLVM